MLNQVHSDYFFNINLAFSGNQRKKLQSPLRCCLFLRRLFLPVSGDLLNSETLETVVAVKLHSGDGKMHHRGRNKQQLLNPSLEQSTVLHPHGLVLKEFSSINCSQQE